jgi:hypothetical protein
MNNSLIYFIGMMAIMTIGSLIFIAAQANTNVTLNDTVQNNTTLIKTSLNFSNNDKAFVDEPKPEETGPIDNLSFASVNLHNVTVQEKRTLSNTIMNNTSLDLTVLNKTVAGVTKPENGNNLSTNVSSSFYTSNQDSNKTVFTIEGNGKAAEQAFKVGISIKPAKNASRLGYIIQATPHGTV